MAEEKKTFAEKARAAVWKYVGAAFLEPKDGGRALSLGRVSFLAVFTLAMWKWAHDVDPATTMVATLASLLGYIGVTKVVDVIRGKSQ